MSIASSSHHPSIRGALPTFSTSDSSSTKKLDQASRLAIRHSIESATLWLEQYREIDPESVISRQWKLFGDRLSGTDIIKLIADHQKPHLPEGYIWFSENRHLKILAHVKAPSKEFKIYTFGPDERHRIDYIVAIGNVPTHGFCMTRDKNEFPKNLRDAYPSRINLPAFKQKGITFQRGHTIDYPDTKGDPSEIKTISTLFDLNFKPEPMGTWARNFRYQAIAPIRKARGSYSELMLYGFRPERTDGGFLIPAAVLLETFNGDQDRQACYYVPKDHECHSWKKNNQKDFSKISLNRLSQPETFPGLVWSGRACLIRRDSEINTTFNPSSVSFKEAYIHLQEAEMEYRTTTSQIIYAIYAKCHLAPIETVDFWLGRAAYLAKQINDGYNGTVPAFQPHLMNSLIAIFDQSCLERNPRLNSYIIQLTIVTENATKSVFKIEKQVFSETELPITPIKQKDKFQDKEDPKGKKPLLRPYEGASSSHTPQTIQSIFTPTKIETTEASPSSSKAINTHFPASIPSFTTPAQNTSKIASISPAPQVVKHLIFQPKEIAPSITEISCQGHLPRNPEAISFLMGDIRRSITNGSPIHLQSVSTAMANVILPLIKQESIKKAPTYKPFHKITVSSNRWLNGTTSIARQLFGQDINVDSVNN